MRSYEALGLHFSHRVGGTTLSANVTNLLDKSYPSYTVRNDAGSSCNAYSQPGRSILFSIEFTI
jgi:outer membrane receptor protein involved in Fe transport